MNTRYPLLSVIGVEIEYMLVDEDTLDVQPKSDVLLKQLAGQQTGEVVLGDVAASNELVLHVLELKNNGPKSTKEPIANHFQQAILELQPLLKSHHLRLLPTGAHPWMNPLLETKRWPHGNKDIYQQYDSIFDCKGHGWSNLQSMHVNLPFANDDEFFKLHNTIRLLLPLLPALAASTPFLDGNATQMLDSRLSFYEKNQQRVPSIAGEIIPEFIQSEQDYQDKILTPMYEAIHPFDPNKILQYEWLNSRAAIAKFEFGAIEIRIIDSQECVNADIAIAYLVHALLKSWLERSQQHLDTICETSRLKSIYDQSITKGFSVIVEDKQVLEQWQLPTRRMNLRDVWSLLIERVSTDLDQPSQKALENILRYGNLSERILSATQLHPNRMTLKRVYRELSECLLLNQQWVPQ